MLRQVTEADTDMQWADIRRRAQQDRAFLGEVDMHLDMHMYIMCARALALVCACACACACACVCVCVCVCMSVSVSVFLCVSVLYQSRQLCIGASACDGAPAPPAYHRAWPESGNSRAFPIR